MPLLAAERKLLAAARAFIESGESILRYNHLRRSHHISLYEALDEVYKRDGSVAFKIANTRISRNLLETGGFWSWQLLRELGYRVWVDIDYGNGSGRIEPGNVSEETFDNWQVLANLAYIDRILETGEIK